MPKIFAVGPLHLQVIFKYSLLSPLDALFIALLFCLFRSNWNSASWKWQEVTAAGKGHWKRVMRHAVARSSSRCLARLVSINFVDYGSINFSDFGAALQGVGWGSDFYLVNAIFLSWFFFLAYYWSIMDCCVKICDCNDWWLRLFAWKVCILKRLMLLLEKENLIFSD